jgi:hypothetical protein
VPRCDFCGSRAVKWVYPAHRDWHACGKCHAAIQADDREALVDRASLIPVPRTVPERYARQYLDRARRLHEEFWETRAGPGRPA